MSTFAPVSVSAAACAALLLAGCAAQNAGGPGPRDSGGADWVDRAEILDVPASGAPVTFKTTLPAGEIALLRANGTVDCDGQELDAEYAFLDGEPADEADGADLGVDIGLLQIRPMVHTTPTPAGPGRMKWYGRYRSDHVYGMTVTGDGKPLTLKLTRPTCAGATGSITVTLIPLSPAPPKIGNELDAVTVPITRTVVTSALTTEADKLYLLQASGAGQVGGGGTHLGDAEYMDWDQEGTRKNEGEAGADFGIGVDEISFARNRGDAYQPRQRWWGPWRRDHIYYMVFAGTGRPIQFLYFDSGYGDNSPTDALTVRVFALP